MTVTAILRQNGSNRVVTIRPEASVAACAAKMAQHHIGVLVASRDDAHVDGVISESDLIRALAEHGARRLDRDVSTVMSRDVERCAPGDRALDILRRMTHGRFRHMPVMIDGGLAALISSPVKIG